MAHQSLGPLPAIAQGLRVVLKGTINGQTWASVQHAKYSGTVPTGPDLNGMCTAWGVAWANSIGVAVTSACVLTRIDASDLTNNTSAVGGVDMTHPGTRAVTGTAPLPSSAAWVQSLTIQRRYRGGHPRIYWPHCNAPDLVNGHQLSDPFLAVAGTSATGYITDVNAILLGGAALVFGAAHYYTHDPVTGLRMYASDPQIFTVTATGVHKRMDSQRRRLGKEIA